MKREACFDVVAVKDGDLYIRDIGPWDRVPTITNDAEGVVKRLIKSNMLRRKMRLFYYDSEGIMDEITHDGEKFTGFKPGPRP